MNNSIQSSRSSSSSGSFMFVRQKLPDDKKQDEKIYEEVFEKAKMSIPEELTINLIDENDVLKIPRRPPSTVFVLSFFEGRVFQHLLSLKCCIVGPPMILSCVRENKPLPKSVEPRYSDVLHEIILCCTGIERNERENIFRLVEYMSGSFTRDLESTNNVLVANDVTSIKYQISCEKNLLIVNSKWVLDIWKRVTFDDDLIQENFDPKNPDYCQNFKCPIFHNLTITVSGLKAEDRKMAEKLITENGGKYEAELINGDCTHLVSSSTDSAKYKAAIKWKIPTVNIRWIEDSVESGYCKNPEHYPVGGNNDATTAKFVIPRPKTDPQLPKISTPTKPETNFARLSSVPDIGNVSAISNHNQQNFISTAAVITQNDSKRTQKVSKFSEKLDFSDFSNSTSISKMKFSDYVKRRRRISPKSKTDFEENESKILRAKSTNALLQGSKAKSGPADSDSDLQDTPLEDLDLSLTTSGQFLKACKIFIFPGQFSIIESEKLKRMINFGGGKRCPALNSAVSHVIVPESHKKLKDLDENLVENLKELIKLSNKNENPPNLHIVTARWLIHCFKNGKILGEKNYQHPEFAYLFPSTENGHPENDKNERLENAHSSSVSLKKFKSFDVGELGNQNKSKKIAEPFHFDDILSQYMDENDEIANDPALNIENMDTDSVQIEKETNFQSPKKRKSSDPNLKEKPLQNMNGDVPANEIGENKSKNLISDDLKCETPQKSTDPSKTSRPKFGLTEAKEYSSYSKERNREKIQLGESPLIADRQNCSAALGAPEGSRNHKKLILDLPGNVENQGENKEPPPNFTSEPAAVDNELSAQVHKSKSAGENLTTTSQKSATSAKTVHSFSATNVRHPVLDHSHSGNESKLDNSAIGEEISAASNQDLPLPQPSQSQACFQIGWDDPCARFNRGKLKLATKRCLEPTQKLDDDIVVEEVKGLNPPKANTVTTFKRKRHQMHFLTTSLDAETKAKCYSIIKSMEASFSDTANFDPSCTHVIVGTPSRNEKLLSSIATGKWILHPSYLVDSQKAGRFLDEEKYEWGGEGMSKYLKNLTDLGRSLAFSCKRWRQTVSRTNRKAYEQFKALLLVDREMETGLKNLIKFGGGFLCEKNTPPSKITHVFFKEGKNKVQNEQMMENLKRLKMARVKCYKPEFLAAFLMDDPSDEKRFLL